MTLMNTNSPDESAEREKLIKDALSLVQDPELHKSIVELGMV